MPSGPIGRPGSRSFLRRPRFNLALPQHSALLLVAFRRIRFHSLLRRGRRCRRGRRRVLIFLFLLRVGVRGIRGRGVGLWGCRAVANGSIQILCRRCQSQHSPARCGCRDCRCFGFLLSFSKLRLPSGRFHRRIKCVGCGWLLISPTRFPSRWLLVALITTIVSFLPVSCALPPVKGAVDITRGS